MEVGGVTKLPIGSLKILNLEKYQQQEGEGGY